MEGTRIKASYRAMTNLPAPLYPQSVNTDRDCASFTLHSVQKEDTLTIARMEGVGDPGTSPLGTYYCITPLSSPLTGASLMSLEPQPRRIRVHPRKRFTPLLWGDTLIVSPHDVVLLSEAVRVAWRDAL